MEWISVKDRTPENASVVLVWSTTTLYPTIAFFYQYDWLYYSINQECFWLKTEPHIKITHWMHLPQPPKQ